MVVQITEERMTSLGKVVGKVVGKAVGKADGGGVDILELKDEELELDEEDEEVEEEDEEDDEEDGDLTLLETLAEDAVVSSGVIIERIIAWRRMLQAADDDGTEEVDGAEEVDGTEDKVCRSTDGGASFIGRVCFLICAIV